MTRIHFLIPAPKECYLAFSGGIDSVVLLDVLLKRKINVTLLTIDHLNEFALEELKFARTVADQHKLNLVIKQIGPKTRRTSQESYWSRERYDIFTQMDKPVLTGHNLSDAVEWYLMSACQGQAKIIAPVNQNIQRPLLTTTKSDIIKYANEKMLTYLTDPTNTDPKFCLRNKVRHQLVGNVKACFPGLETTVRKLILKRVRHENQ